MAGKTDPSVIYLQYTNPAGYPPLEHSSRILADKGWRVLFLGAAAFGADGLTFPKHPRIEVRRVRSFGSGVLQKLNYVWYVVWSVIICLWRRPDWIYASEPMAAAPAMLASLLTRSRVIYHEHDSPTYTVRTNWFQTLFRRARQRIARTADLCILPQHERLEQFLAATGRREVTLCVWNCPRMEEISPRRSAGPAGRPLRLYYHGSLNRDRLPLSVLDGLARGSTSATLTIIGYETVGSRGFVEELLQHARHMGLSDRVEVRGAMSRSSIMAEAANADVGLSFMPVASDEINMTKMVGASNKPFDYLAAGAALLVSDLPAWRSFYVGPGYAMACNPGDPQAVAQVIAWCESHRDVVRQMGEAGRIKMRAEWNYECQFEPILAAMSAATLTRRLSA